MKENAQAIENIEMENLFESAKKIDSSKGKKSSILSLAIPSELHQPLKDYKNAKTEVKNWKAKLDISESIIKDKAKILYLSACKKHTRNIGSFKLGDITVSVQDRYTNLDETTGPIVQKNFPNAVVKMKEYFFNQEILKKHIVAISNALKKADMPKEDLTLLIQSKEVYSVKKGAIDTLPSYDEEMDDFFQAISPIISMR
jgi:hypothetical protein